MNTTYLMPIITFLLVTGISIYISSWLEERHRRAVITKRLLGSSGHVEKSRGGLPDFPWQRVVHSLGLLAIPKAEQDLTDLRNLLTYAGYRSNKAPVVYYGMKLGSALVLGTTYLVTALLSGSLGLKGLLFTFIPLGLGYHLPGVFLKFRVASRQQRIFKELPDTLDLLLICIGAGLSFDMALYRVSRELSDIAPVLSREFGQYFLEIQSGLPRKGVLKNLAERNGVKSLTSVVNVLMQSAKFGTDVGEALRVYIGSMRVERRQIAEEKGAKISVKLTFPLIILILPALLIVILGPAVINLMERLQGGF